jgi:rSAM/selenodomain-associated transferase 2
MPSVPSSGAPTLSVVVPTLNEAHTLPALLADLAALRLPHEVVVVDGGSADATAAIADAAGARIVRSAAGRGTQLRAGAAAARGRVLCFLHADARLPPDTRAALERVAGEGRDGVAVAFTLRIAGAGWRYRFVEWGTERRSRLARLPYGDQGLVLTRTTYHDAGGFPDLPLMEDVALVRALAGRARVCVLPEPIVVSARRWERDGVLRRMLRNWTLLAAYLGGVPAARLARAYRPFRGVSPGG